MDLELNHLTEEERDRILSVLRRDEDLRAKDLDRIRQLKIDLKKIRLKGVIKEGHDPDKTCARCREKFGWFFDKGTMCPQCQHKVCDKCKEPLTEGENKWLCVLCFKQMELDAMSGQWFLMKFRKSKRNKKTNKVITGQELVKTSIRHRPHSAGGSGSEAGRTTSDDVRKTLTNNNSSPKSSRSVGSGSLEESSDTQSTASTSPGRKKRGPDVHDIGFPKESDKQKLLDLIRSKAPVIGKEEIQKPTVEVRKVSLSRYRSDSESSSSSGPSSPQLSARTDSEFRYSDSIRSSIRSSGAFSAVSSEGRITIVTESCVSDMDSHSVTSQMSMSDSQGSPALLAGPYDKEAEHFQSTDSVIENKAHRQSASVAASQPPQTKLTALCKDTTDGSVSISDNEISVRKVSTSKHADSMSSDSEAEEVTTTQVSKVKFRRIPMAQGQRRSRSPSPEPRSRSRANDVTANGSRQPNGHGDASSVTSSLTESDAGSGSPRVTSRREHKTSITSVPSINITHHDSAPEAESGRDEDAVAAAAAAAAAVVADTQARGAGEPSVGQGSGTEGEECEDIDELVASHTSPSHSIHSQKGGSMLSPFSGSRESIVSFYSDAGEGTYGNIPVTGEIQFALDYNYKTGSLELKVKQCRDLAPVDTKKKRSDPYVKVYLLPDKTKSGKRKTRVKKHTLNPVFDEVLKYAITKSELETRTLWMTVWHSDMFGRNDFLGEVTIPLDYYSFGEKEPQWYKLQERPTPPEDESAPTKPMQPMSFMGMSTKGVLAKINFGVTPNASPLSLLTYKGDLILSLRYVTGDNAPSAGGKVRGGGNTSKRRPGSGELHVLLKEARNLTAVRANGFSDPFCKGYLLPDKGRGTKQKTPVAKRDCNPQWNHTFVFEDVSLEDLRDRSLELTVWDHDRFTSNDFLGGLRLNIGAGKVGGKEVDWMDSRGEEVSMWQAMLDRPNCWIDGSLMLRTTMERRK